MTSSHSSPPPPYEGVVRREGQAIGPIRLPLVEPERFIKEFNDRYRRESMSVVAVITVCEAPALEGP